MASRLTAGNVSSRIRNLNADPTLYVHDAIGLVNSLHEAAERDGTIQAFVQDSRQHWIERPHMPWPAVR